MIVNEIVLITRWTSDVQGNHPDLSAPVGCAWEDITGQPAHNLPCRPNFYLIRARVTDAALSAIQASTKYIVLARRTYDDQTQEVSFDNFSEQPTPAQLTALKNLILSRYPDADEDALVEAGKQIISAGLTREEIIQLLAKRWQKFLRVVM